MTSWAMGIDSNGAPQLLNISSGTVPNSKQESTSVVTSATTTFVTALTTSVTITQTCPIVAYAMYDLKATTAACIAQVRITINGVAGQLLDISIDNTTDHLTGVCQALSASLSPGTYTVNAQIARLSGSGTVNFFQGSLISIGLQGTSSNGVTALTGDVTASGSGSIVTTISSGAVTGAKIAASTITNSNISTVDASKITTGTLPVTRGGTGAVSFPNTRVPVSNGTNFVSDASFLYDPTLHRLSVGSPGSAAITGTVLSGSDLALQAYSRGTNNAFQVQNENAWSCSLVNAGSAVGATINAEYSRGTLIARTQSKSGDTLFSLNAQGYTTSGFATGYSSNIAIQASEDTTATNQGGEVVISSTPNGSISVVERLRVKNSGECVFTGALASARMSSASKNALTPTGGWVVFDTDLNKLSYYNGSSWINL